MKRLAELAVEWAELPARTGLTSSLKLLDANPTKGVAGRWQALVKPGLGGRERWRWNLDDAQNDVLYVKRYVRTSISEQLDRIRRQAARHSRGWWEYQQSAELTRKHIPVVRAIGFAEEMRSVLEVRSAVLFERVAGDAFDRVWAKLAADNAPITRGLARHDTARRLARFVSAFHQTGTCHRDLYLCHIFAELDPGGGQPPRFTLLDLARTHRPRWRRTRWLIKDLSQLDTSARQIGASRADRMRFLLTYLGLQPRAPRARWYARRVVRKSGRILRRIERKNRRT